MRIILCTKAKSTIMYHGTSSTKLREILKKGLIQEHKDVVWGYPEDLTYNIDVDRALPGTYLTNSLKIALSYARSACAKFGGDNIIVLTNTVLSTSVIDEDLVEIGELLENDCIPVSAYSNKVGTVSLPIYNKFSKWIAMYISYLHGDILYKNFEQNAVKIVTEFFDIKKEVPSIVQAIKNIVLAYTLRQVMYMKRQSYFRPTVDILLERVFKSKKYTVESFKERLAEDAGTQVNTKYREALSALLKYSRNIVLDKSQHTKLVRVPSPITFSGANRILAIVSVQVENGITVAVPRYGKVPDSFLKKVAIIHEYLAEDKDPVYR